MDVPQIRSSPYCAQLRSKKFYFLQRPPMEEEDLADGSGHCWCLKTMHAQGPDGDAVEPADCQAGRACFESIL